MCRVALLCCVASVVLDGYLSPRSSLPHSHLRNFRRGELEELGWDGGGGGG